VVGKKNPRNITINKPLLTAFQKQWPGFKSEPIETQISLIHTMRRSYHKRRQHKENEEAFYMSWKELEKEYGRGGFNEVNERLKLFHIVAEGSPSRGVTKQYLLDDKADQIYATARHKRPRGKLTKVLDGVGKFINKLPGVLASKDVKNVTAKFWSDEQIPQLVPVNIEALDKLAEQLKQLENKPDLFVMADKRKIEHRLYYINELRSDAHWEITGRGNVAHRYQEAKTGRLSAMGINLQNAPRTVRKAALVNQWDYDFENCHYAIMQQMAKRYDMECPNIECYLRLKSNIRKYLADEIGVHVKQIKRALIAIIYGAHASSSEKAALFDAVGGKEKARLLINTQTFSNLHKEVKQARNVILDNWPTSRGSLINACDKGISEKEDKNKRMAHLIQGVEAFMLRTALRLYPDDIILLVHDGFVSTRQLDRERIIKAIKGTAGYDMDLSEERISMPHDYDMEAG